MAITHIIFDLDGLLIDSEVIFSDCINKIIKPFNKEISYEIKEKYMGHRLIESLGIIKESLSIPLELEEMEKQYTKLKEEYMPHVELMPGATELINFLSKNDIPMAIATGSSENSYKMKTDKNKELFANMSHTVCSGSDPKVKKTKPEPDVFLEAARRFNEPLPKSSRNILVFEDSPNGVRAALAAEMPVVWIPDAKLDTTIFKNNPNVFIMKSLKEFDPEKFINLPQYTAV